MPVTALDPSTALIIIDLQNGIVSLPTIDPIENILAQASALAAAFRRHRLPVVLVTVVDPKAPGRTDEKRPPFDLPAGWADIVPQLDQQPSDHTVTKRTWGAFTNTGLDAYLKANAVTQIVLAGVATSIGVESTARHGYELGFNLTLALDAMTDRNADAQANSVSRIFPRIGETGSTAEIIALLDSSRT